MRLTKGRKPERIESIDALPDDGLAWLDVVRGEGAGWVDEVRRLVGVEPFEAHVKDSENAMHPSYFDGADEYEMLIFRGLVSSEEAMEVETRPAAFFLFPRLLVTVRAAENISVDRVWNRLADGSGRVPARPTGLMLAVLSAIVDRFLALREPLSARLDEWQDALLDASNPFDDWQLLMRQRSELRRLERLCDQQLDALTQWQEETAIKLDASITVRVNDVLEHIRRVLVQAQSLQAQIESLVQVHFAAVAHRTNEIVRVLTVLTAVFLPLTLIAGIFGMNFENMPELKLRYGYFAALLGMGLLAGALLWFFRRKRWF